SWQHRLVDGACERVAMLQYPAGALCTELWKRVGEISRSAEASVAQIWWRFSPSPEEDVNTVAVVAVSRPAWRNAACPAASASLTGRPVRRRSAAGSRSLAVM